MLVPQHLADLNYRDWTLVLQENEIPRGEHLMVKPSMKTRSATGETRMRRAQTSLDTHARICAGQHLGKQQHLRW